MDVTILASTEQEIHAIIKVHSSNLSWLITGIYASPRYRERRILWDNLNKVATLHNLPWLVLGDFNEILSSEDKLGGRPINLYRPMVFQQCLNSYNLLDLGFQGPRFTWVNKRDFLAFIQERIDRCFANSSWRTMYPEASVYHLTRLHSDHCPVLLSLNPSNGNHSNRPFRFQPMWLSHPHFTKLVQDNWNDSLSLQANNLAFNNAARVWNKEVFGNVFHKKSRLEARIKGTQHALTNNPNQFLINLERTLLKEYNLILQQEHDLYATKSRYNWAILGDRNTSFFHTSTIVRRKRNRIEKILDSSDNWVHEANEVADVVKKGFIKLFCTEKTSVIRNHWVLPRWSNVLSEEALSSLNHPISPMEIRDALWSIKPFKAPGPDGLHAGFYQNSWSIVRESVEKVVFEAFRTGSILDYCPPNIAGPDT